MAKTGRPKKYNNLTLMNVFVEKEDIEILKIAVELYNEKHKLGGAYSLSILVRDLISTHSKRVKNSKDFIEFNEKSVEENHQVAEDVEEKNHKEEVRESSYVIDNTQEVLQEINSKQDTQCGNNPFNDVVWFMKITLFILI